MFEIWGGGLKSREVGTIEAADSLNGEWLTRTDENTHHKYVNTNYNKIQRIKTPAQLAKDKALNSPSPKSQTFQRAM